ncbi:MAG: GNAT family N-acetyltransferase [Planctomycetota bacterium]
MTPSEGLQVRRLRRGDDAAAALAEAAGVHGVYVRNALSEGLSDGFVFAVDGRDCGVAWFGPRGNLVVVSDQRAHGHERDLAAQVLRARWSWRIVLGDAGLVDALAAVVPRRALAHRDQIYYCGGPDDANPKHVRDDLREPEREDRERLARATLALNASDLNIAPDRVDRRWLYSTIDDRIHDGTTRVLGPVGGLWSKLDFGSQGPGGVVIEGVYTFPERRGRGLGADLVASCMAQSRGAVSLHVAEHNRAARRSYERAGLREAGRCRLLLLG